MPVAGLGHVGIYTDDLMKQRDFYTRVIGLSIADEDLDGRGMCFMSADPVSEHHEFVLMKGRVSSDDTNTPYSKFPSKFLPFKISEIITNVYWTKTSKLSA